MKNRCKLCIKQYNDSNMYKIWHIAGNFGGVFNLPVWWFSGYLPNLKSTRICFNLLHNVNIIVQYDHGSFGLSMKGRNHA